MLEKLFNPKSVAIIGAARQEGKVGHVILDNLIEGGYKGSIYPVNPKADKIHNVASYGRLADISGDVDLAIIVTPSPTIPKIINECGMKGIKNVIIISAGFKETGIEGARLEGDIVDIAKKYKIRLLGPNCLGLINARIGLNASFTRVGPLVGNIAFISQSGALQSAILDWSREIGLGFSKFVSLGNKADLDEVDFLEALADDDETKVICLYLEGIKEGPHFLRVAAKIAQKKPIVALKAGRTEAGARAVSSHTGTLAGSNKAYTAAFTQSGIIQADSLRELFNFALILSTQPIPDGNKVAIVTNAGGPAILASDAVSASAQSVASLNKKTIDKLEGFLPAAANIYNPIDLLGDAKADRYEKAMKVVLEDQNVDSVITILTPQAMTEIEETAQVIARVHKNTKKPIVASFMGGTDIKQSERILKKNSIPNYIYPEDAVKALGSLVTYKGVLSRPKPVYKKFRANKKAVAEIIEKSKKEQRVNLSYTDANSILEAYSISTPKSALARSSTEALKLADSVNYPVALKIVSSDILHKTDIGGVITNIDNKNDIIDGYEKIIINARKYMPNARIDGVLVQQMVSEGEETIVGVSSDPQFGPLILFGLGGVYVEVLKDVSFRVAPLSVMDVKKMISEVKSYLILKGIRSKKVRDIEAIEDVLLKVSQLVLDFREIVEMDLNPLIVKEEKKGVVAADVRMSISLQN